MSIIKTNNFDTLYEFSLSVAFISDSILIFSKVKELLFRHIECDEILLFLDDRERNCLSAPYPYNPTRNLKDYCIPYKDTLVKNILIERKSYCRAESEDRLFQEYRSELFVPLVSPEDTLGFIYLGRQSNQTFSDEEIKLVEFAATYITTPLVRSSWEERLLRSQSALQKWQEKYVSLIDALPYPAAVVDFEENKFNEVNEGFVSLSGKDFQNIYSTPVSQLVQVEGVEDYKDISSGQHYQLRFNSKETLYPCTFSPIDAQEKALKLLSVVHGAGKAEVDKCWNQTLFDFYKSVDPEQELPQIFIDVVPVLANLFGSGYFTLHSVTRDNRLILEAAYTFKGEYRARPNDHILAAINEGPMISVIQSRRPQFVPDVFSDPQFREWLPIARRVGYRSFVSIPVDLKQYGIDIISLFVSEANPWEESTRNWLNNFAQISRDIIYRHHLSLDLKKRSEQIEILAKLTKEINSQLDFQSVIKTAALEMRKVIPFDYFSIILFDDEGKDDQVFDLAVNAAMEKLGPEWDWQPVEKTDLGWVVRSENRHDIQESDSSLPQRMPFSLPSHTSVLLLSGENYLGNCALGRIEPRAFLQPELQFLRQVAGQIATAIKNSRLYGQTETRLNEISILAKVSRSISETLDVDAILRLTAEAARESLLSPDSKIIEIDDQPASQELFFWMPSSVRSHLGSNEINQIVMALEKIKLPFVIDSPSRFIEQFVLDSVTVDALEGFKPFIMAPIFRKSILFACLVAASEADPSIYEHDLEIITTLSSQAENAISKADLFQTSIKNAEELESFVYSVSHELKTPILTVQSFASLLKEEYDKILPPQASKYLDRISVNLSQMQTLIMDLLDLSRIGRDGIELVECDTRQAVEQAIESLAGLLKAYPTQITIDEPLPTIYAHSSLITQVFSNLISNAVKYSKKKKSPQVWIGCQEGRASYEFYVRDNGVGIPEELLDRIFDLFHTQPDNDEEMSTGVGLTIVKKIIELHNGRIEVESKIAKGSTFTFTMPKKQSN